MKRIITTIIIATILLPAGFAKAAGNGSPWEEQAIALVNQERESHGLPTLTVNETLARVAKSKLDDMVQKKYFAHTSPDNKTPWSFFDAAGYDYRFAGENLAIHFTNPESEHEAWMKSEKHCQNILDPRFREIGMASKKVFMEGNETILVVQSFGTRLGDETVASSAKDVAVAMCRGEIPPTVSGVSGEKDTTGRIALSVSQVTGRFDQTIGQWLGSLDNGVVAADILALLSFALLQVLAIVVAVKILMTRKYSGGVFPS
ncbi:MAG: CAP domain-containing protein [Candidatus Moraniibacteriota bacterium]